MSEPKRYGIDPKYCSIEEFEDGQYVSYEDYARLKADAERYRLASLRVDVSELHAQFNRALFDETVAENARLKAEVERLTKAGDVLANNIVWVELYRPLVAKWNAAKEGKKP